MKYRVIAHNLHSFEMGQIVDEHDLALKGVPIERRVLSGHLEPVVGYDDSKKSKKTNSTSPESE
jgi:C1A family cysteine protease